MSQSLVLIFLLGIVVLIVLVVYLRRRNRPGRSASASIDLSRRITSRRDVGAAELCRVRR